MKKYLFLITGCLFSALAHSVPAPAAEAFQVNVNAVDPNTLTINWLIKPGYFLYKDRIHVKESPGSNAQLSIIRFPRAEKKTDLQGKTFSVYRKNLSLTVAVLGTQPGETLAKLSYQGCSEDGFCYPPETRQIKLSVNENNELSSASLEPFEEATPKAAEQAPEKMEKTKEEAVFEGHLIMIILSFFGFGLLLAFTPCVLPMVPVLSGIIVGHGKDLTTRKAFFLSLSYVLSMALTYALVGAIVAMLGSNLQIIMQSPWAISLFSLIFILLSLSMFGYYELKLPTSWQAKLARISRSQGSGHYLSAAIMGSLSTLILSPCVTAPLIGALSYIAHSGNVLIGSLALFFLGLGMGLPLLLIGTSAGQLLPKVGPWMNTVKSFFGVVLIGMAIYLMERILPGIITMLMWGILFVFAGVYSGAIRPRETQGKFNQSIGIILLTYGLLILVGASMGHDNPLMPLKPLTSSSQASSLLAEQRKIKVKTLADVNRAIKNAEGKPVMIDFYADWCNSCKVMEATTFQDPAVKEALEHFVILKADITAHDSQDKTLLKHFNVVAPPTFLFFDKQGDEISQLRIVGELGPEAFLKQIKNYQVNKAPQESSLNSNNLS